MTFGKWLKEQRLDNALSQRELAEKLSIDVVSVNFLENDKHFPSIKTLKKIADFFNVPVAELRKMEVK